MGLRPSVIRGVVSLAGGTCAFAIGAGLAGPLAGTAAALPLIGPYAGELGKKLQEFVTEKFLSAGWEAVVSRLDLAGDAGLPPNHDLLRAIRQSGLLSLRYCIQRCESDVAGQPHEFDSPTVLAQCKRASRWISAELKASEAASYFDRVEVLSALEAVGKSVASARDDAQAREVFDNLFSDSTKAALAELDVVLGAPTLQPIRDWMLGRAEVTGGQSERYAPGWCLAAGAFFTEKVKQQPKLMTIVFARQLDALVQGQADMAGALDRGLDVLRWSASEVSRRLDTLETTIRTLQAEERTLFDTERDRLLWSVAEDRVDDRLAERLRTSFPRGSRWSQTASQVRDRLAHLDAGFVGRIGILDSLTDFVERQRKGLIVVAAPAGHGKSALVAAWVGQRLHLGDCVARHFISLLHDRTTLPAEVLGHLLVQVRDEENSPGELLETPEALGQSLHEAVSRKRPAGSRLIIVVDGLDEAWSIVPPFLETDLADDVYVIVSCRAQPDESPPPLKPWLRRLERGLPGLRVDVGPLPLEEIMLWLEQTGIALSGIAVRQLAELLARTSEGIPLFLGFLIADLRQLLGGLDSRDVDAHLQHLFHDFPATFAEYVNQQFDELSSRGGSSVWSQEHRRLLATLCRAAAPIRERELESALDKGPDLLTLDHRVARWLSIEGIGANRRYALAHSRLKEPLAAYLGAEADDAEDALVRWARDAWHPQGSVQRRSGSFYALDWLPTHLLRIDEEAAEALLRTPAFLAERLRQADLAVARLERSSDEWARLSPLARRSPQAGLWTNFWAENATRLRLAIGAPVLPQGYSAAKVVLDCMGDAGLAELDEALVVKRACVPHRAPDRPLVRSHDDAHDGMVNGMLRLDDGTLVSWANDGAVRCWSSTGDPLEGGSRHAHAGPVRGLMQTGRRLVSWGTDGSVRFWSVSGVPLTGGAVGAHTGWVLGVTQVGDRLISWGADRSLRFWSLDGGLIGQADIGAHKGQILGFLAVAGALVSWDSEGAFFRWGMDGQRLAGGDEKAHSGGIWGMRRTRHGLVSWGRSDGALMHWTDQGEVEDGFVAHERWVVGVLEVEGGLVSWGTDGVIRFWTSAGRPKHDGEVTHSGGVNGVTQVGDELLSWGDDGAIRFWSPTGGSSQRRAIERAHAGRVEGVVALQDGRLVSWGSDLALRCWSRVGRLLGDSTNAHAGMIVGALPIDDGHFVSWGMDGAVRFWRVGHGQTKDSAGREHWPRVPETHPICGIVELSRGQGIATFTEGGAVQLWGDHGALMSIVADAHVGSAYHLLQSDDRLISAGKDGAVRIWALDGQPLEGGARQAHAGPVLGLKLVDGVLLSWGRDRARVWTSQGQPVDRELSVSEQLQISAALQLDDRLVTWTTKGSIRFWSAEGEVQDAGAAQAHQGGVGGLLRLEDRLVSWGDADGTIRFWSLAGKDIPGGASDAHVGRVSGVIRAGDRLVSRGDDGAIRFWSLVGDRLEGGSPRAHRGWILGLLAHGRRIVSWGRDGVIRFWSIDGDYEGVLVPPGGCNNVAISSDGARLLVGGRVLWVYALGE
jgi:WD40 repeat protein